MTAIAFKQGLDDSSGGVTTMRAAPSLSFMLASEPETGTPNRQSTLSSRRVIRADLVALRDDDVGAVRVPILLRRRSQVGGLASVSGEDLNDVIQVGVTVTPRHTLRLSVTFHPSEDSTASAMLPVLRLMEELATGARFGLWFHDTNTWAGSPIAVNGALPRVPSDYLRAVEAIARVEAGTGARIPMPATIDEADAAEINRALVLLSGATVSTRWDEAVIELGPTDPGDLDLRADDDAEFEVESVIDFEVRIAGISVPLGQVNARFASAKVVATEEVNEIAGSALRITMKPGSLDSVDLQVVERSHFDPYSRLDPELVVVEDKPSGNGLRDLLRR